MKAVHPFPARMAPEMISDTLSALPPSSIVLDPMCGSGVVVREAAIAGHIAIGADVDPLAVLMSRVWTQKVDLDVVREQAQSILDQSFDINSSTVEMPWIDNCEETKKFVSYWFAKEQENDLRALLYVMNRRFSRSPRRIRNIFYLAVSRTIITKHYGASLGWDISHSRPHKVKSSNDYDVKKGFLNSVNMICSAIENHSLKRDAKIYRADARQNYKVGNGQVDIVLTSPPYLNAIDYMRGHKFSLIWLGYSIPELRRLRANAVGAEKSAHSKYLKSADWKIVCEANPILCQLPSRQFNIIGRYTCDASKLLKQFKRVLKPGGQLVLVLGNSFIRGVNVENSKIYDQLARKFGFKKLNERKRCLPENKRYLPTVSKNKSLENRMRYEIIQTYQI